MPPLGSSERPSTTSRRKIVHKPHHLTALAVAAEYIAYKMDHYLVLPDHIPGYLVVHDSSGQALLTLHVGTFGHVCGNMYAELATASNDIIDCKSAADGTTSSQTDPRAAGSVFASQLVVGYASRDGHHSRFADEAVAIMMVIRAGLLTRNAIRKRYCNHRLKEHNPHLRKLIDTITWTS